MPGFVLTVADGATQSNSVDLQGLTAVGLFLPSGLEGTTVTFQTSLDDSTYVDVQNGAGSAYTVTVAASKYVPLDPTVMCGVRFLKVTVGSSQTGASEITLVARQV